LQGPFGPADQESGSFEEHDLDIVPREKRNDVFKQTVDMANPELIECTIELEPCRLGPKKVWHLPQAGRESRGRMTTDGQPGEEVPIERAPSQPVELISIRLGG
jgi:hypothetical protein